jgi:hypothetical protein
MRLDVGNVMAAKMSAHRHQWNGTICSQPQAWNCGAESAFRSNFCDTGVPRCFHLDVFKPTGGSLYTVSSPAHLAIAKGLVARTCQLMFEAT